MSDYPHGPEPGPPVSPPASPPPVQPRSELPRSTAIWSWLCLASLGLAGLFFLYGKHLAMSPLPRGAWFAIADGLVTLGELTCWTAAGIAAIGSVVSWSLAQRRPPSGPAH
jgi:hypothetical protein